MRTNTINLQLVFNLGNYETMRIGAEFTPDSTQDFTSAMKEADKMLREAAAAIMNKQAEPEQVKEQSKGEQPVKVVEPAKEPSETPDANKIEKEPEDTRELLTFNSKKFAQVVKRIEAGVPLATVEQHFRFDKEATKLVAELCEKLNKKQ